MFTKALKVAVLTLLAYLLQTTAAEYLSIADVAPNLALVIIAIATVALGRRTGQWNPHLRTPLCAALSVTVFEAVHLLYTYLSGVSLDAGHWQRALTDVLYSMVLAGVLQFPVRWWLGVYKLKKAR